jgi:hypothetical protein
MLAWHTSSSISDWFQVATPDYFMISLENIEPDSGDIGHLLPKTVFEHEEGVVGLLPQ